MGQKYPIFYHHRGTMFDENLKELIVEAKEKLGERAAEIIRKELKIENWDKDTLKGSCP